MNKNSLGRVIPKGMIPFQGIDNHSEKLNRHLIPEIKTKHMDKQVQSLSELFDLIPITDGMTLSFHHHLRNGDGVMNLVLAEIKKRNLKKITLAPSAIFPVHEPLVELIKNHQVTKIYTNYINGPVADVIGEGYLDELLVMDTHGGRPRAIESGELMIDVAFIGVPTSDRLGNGHGRLGQSACGALGYAIADMKYAQHKVVLTDHLIEHVENPEILSEYIDYVIHVDSLGVAKEIVSGTTKPTKDPVQLKIAKDTVKLMDALGFIKHGMSFQTGAGGTSIAVAEQLKQQMVKYQIKGSFASGGITGYLVEMHELGLFERLYDVQCFDHEAIASLNRNKNHLLMSASKYANPNEDLPIVNDLDVVILGATEVDENFNVNVTTDSHGKIIGGSGGHSDTAYGAKLTIITTNLIKSRLPIVKKTIDVITTPGETVDCIVTERGIAIHPNRKDLLEKLKDSHLKIVTIDTLIDTAIAMTGRPKLTSKNEALVGVIRYRDGSIIDGIHKLKGK